MMMVAATKLLNDDETDGNSNQREMLDKFVVYEMQWGDVVCPRHRQSRHRVSPLSDKKVTITRRAKLHSHTPLLDLKRMSPE
jgi:hypothetical protein